MFLAKCGAEWLLNVSFWFNGRYGSNFCHFKDPLSKIFFLIKKIAMNSSEHGFGFQMKEINSRYSLQMIHGSAKP